MTKSEAFKAAHAETRRVIAEQIATKHPSGHRSYAEIFASCLRGAAIIRKRAVVGFRPNVQRCAMGIPVGGMA